MGRLRFRRIILIGDGGIGFIRVVRIGIWGPIGLHAAKGRKFEPLGRRRRGIRCDRLEIAVIAAIIGHTAARKGLVRGQRVGARLRLPALLRRRRGIRCDRPGIAVIAVNIVRRAARKGLERGERVGPRLRLPALPLTLVTICRGAGAARFPAMVAAPSAHGSAGRDNRAANRHCAPAAGRTGRSARSGGRVPTTDRWTVRVDPSHLAHAARIGARRSRE